MFAVTLAASALLGSSWLVAQILTPTYGQKAKVDKGPRALGLVQISATGKKSRLIPVAIMMDGKFYDAGSYKASPVPLALDFGIVYEGFRSGVSQGTFTITQPGQLNHTWIAEGTWLPAGAKGSETHKKYSPPVIADDDKEGPPVLHRRSEKADSDKDSGSAPDSKDNKAKDDNKDQQKTATASPQPPSPPPAGSPPSPDATKAPAAPEPAKPSASASSSASSPSSDDEQNQDPNRPRLRRGKPDPAEHHEPFTTFDAPAAAKPASAAPGMDKGKPDAKAVKDSSPVPQIVTVPAISDAHGPDPRPYTYDVKPAEEAGYRNKMLALAAKQARASTGGGPKEGTTSKKSFPSKAGSKSAGNLPELAFDEVSLHIFDLSNSNEPVLVLSAKTHPRTGGATESLGEPKEITLIARTNLEGELQKLFFSETDSRHLDITPRMELIDAVDADGDGRGELLFRRTFDDGSAYAIYRVTADRLWPLFEGTP